MNDVEFLCTCYMSRKNMNKLIDICKHHTLFEVLNRNKTEKKENTERRTRNHLMYLLCFIGTFGEGDNNINSRNRHKQGHGAHKNMRNACTTAILDCMKK